MPEPNRSPPALTMTKALSWLIMALMLASIVYASGIAILNWHKIGV